MTNEIGFYCVAGGIASYGRNSESQQSYLFKDSSRTDDPVYQLLRSARKGGLIIGMFGWGYIEGLTGSMHNSVLAMLILFTVAYIAMMSFGRVPLRSITK